MHIIMTSFYATHNNFRGLTACKVKKVVQKSTHGTASFPRAPNTITFSSIPKIRKPHKSAITLMVLSFAISMKKISN